MLKRKLAISDIRLNHFAGKYVNQVLKSNRLTYGKFTRLFEKELAKKLNRRYVLFVNSGTNGLQLALQAMKELYGWQDGDEVIVPAVTFIATSNAILQANLQPIFADVEEDHYCLNPEKIAAKISKKTRAILPVHLFGQSSDMAKILPVAEKFGLKILEDSCETMFVKYRNKQVGTLGDISVFSTYATHILTTGVGGVVTTNNKKLFTIMESLVFHGRDNIYLNIDDDDDIRDKKTLEKILGRRFLYNHIGFSIRLTEMEAALGLAQLKEVDRLIKKRQENAQKITRTLSQFKDFQLPSPRPGAEHCYMLYPILIKNPKIRKIDLLLYLEQNGIETRELMPLLNQPIYKKIFGDIEKNYPTAKSLVERGFIIGSHPFLADEDIKYLEAVFKNYLNK